MVLIDQLKMENFKNDTTMLIDSAEVAGEWKIDTSYTYGKNSNSTSISEINPLFLEKYYTEFETEFTSFFEELIASSKLKLKELNTTL